MLKQTLKMMTGRWHQFVGFMLCPLMLLMTVVVQAAPKAIVKYEKNGVAFSYLTEWQLKEDITFTDQNYTIKNESGDFLIISVLRTPLTSPEELAVAYRALTAPALSDFIARAKASGSDAQPKPISTEIGGVKAEGTQLQLSLDSKTRLIDVYWLALNKHVVTIALVRSAIGSPFDNLWNTVRGSLRVNADLPPPTLTKEQLVTEQVELVQRGRQWLAQGEIPPYVFWVLRVGELTETISSPDEVKAIAEMLNQLGESCFSQGYLPQAQSLFIKALSMREKALGPKHLDVATSLNNLAVAFMQEGQLDQAEKMLLRCLAIREELLGKEHRSVVKTLINLAGVHGDLGNYDEAARRYAYALEVAGKVMKEDDPLLASLLNNYGSMYLKARDLVKAEEINKRALDIAEKYYKPDSAEYATALHNHAVSLASKSDFKGAIEGFKRALALREKLFGRDSQSVAVVLLGLGTEYKDMGDYAQAEPLLKQALEIVEKVYGSGHLQTLSYVSSLGELFQDKRDFKHAQEYFQRVIAVVEERLGPEHPRIIEALSQRARLYIASDDIRLAEPLLERALQVARKKFPAEHTQIAEVLEDIGVVHHGIGKLPQAEQAFRNALAIYEKNLGPDHPAVSTAASLLAQLLRDTGNYGEAEPLYRRALSIKVKRLGPDHRQVISLLTGLGDLYVARGDEDLAVGFFEEARGRAEKIGGEKNLLLAEVLNGLAKAYRQVGRKDDAIASAKRSLKIRTELLGAEHALVGRSQLTLARIYRSQKNYVEAAPLLQNALTISERAEGPDHVQVATVLAELGILNWRLGDYTQAEQFYKRALHIYENVYSTAHFDVATTLLNLGLLYETKGDLVQAQSAFKRSSDIRAHNLALFLNSGSEENKQRYINTLNVDSSIILSFNALLAPRNQEATALAFTNVLLRKGRVLDAVSGDLKSFRRNLKPQDQALLDELADKRRQLAAKVNKGPGSSAHDKYLLEVATQVLAIQRLEAQISERSAQLRVQTQTVTIKEIQNALPPESALVEYVLFNEFNPRTAKEWGGARYAAYILQKTGEPVLVLLPPAGEVDLAINKFRASLRYPKSEDYLQTGRLVDEKVMQPVRQVLGGVRNVFISPEGLMNLIPFAALVDENQQFLVANYMFTYLTGGRDLLRLQVPAARRASPVVVANPKFSASFALPAAANTRQGTQQPNSVAETKQWEPLPDTLGELNVIAKLLPDVKPLTDAAATEEAIKKLSGPYILHVATHGFFKPTNARTRPAVSAPAQSVHDADASGEGLYDNPMLRSGLVLAGANTGQGGHEDDGRLTALESLDLDLQGTKLVVLSACETGEGDLSTGEGIYGLRRALAIAGAESTVVTLWRVKDAVTPEVMQNYYMRLLRGHEGRTAALQNVQRDMLKGKYKHPYYWAAFILSGDWRPLVSPAAQHAR